MKKSLRAIVFISTYVPLLRSGCEKENLNVQSRASTPIFCSIKSTIVDHGTYLPALYEDQASTENLPHLLSKFLWSRLHYLKMDLASEQI